MFLLSTSGEAHSSTTIAHSVFLFDSPSPLLVSSTFCSAVEEAADDFSSNCSCSLVGDVAADADADADADDDASETKSSS